MKFWLPLIFTFFSVSAIAQTTVYQAFEIDTAAQPRGGITALNTFILANLRKPIAAEAIGNGGRVIIDGIVETDGSVSTIKIVKSLRHDCDQEATRVFSLFNAWKPAYKDGKAVRQRVNLPIVFNANTPFIY